MFEYVFTIGCFDRFHKGHIKLLEEMTKKCEKLIIGIHDTNSIKKIKNIKEDNVQDLETRKTNIEKYAFDMFEIYDEDPTSAIKEYIEKNDMKTTSWCYMRADDNKTFPGIEYVSSMMPIEYLPYTATISTTQLRKGNTKVAVMNNLLETVSLALKDNNVPFYLDCGTLLGCVRDNELMEKDTDVDITTHLSFLDKIFNVNFSKYGLTVMRKNRKCRLMSLKFSNNKLYCDIYANPAFPLLEKIVLNGVSYPVPKNPEKYLEKLYSKNWKIPSNKHADSGFHREYGLVESDYSSNWDKKYEIVDFRDFL